jgi:hypothetical protein
MGEKRNRAQAPESGWRPPIVPPDGIGVIAPSCDERAGLFPVPARVGVGLRVGGNVAVCLACGPEGGVYHPSEGYAMTDVRAVADRLPFAAGYDPADLTPAVMKAYDLDLRRRLGLHEA